MCSYAASQPWPFPSSLMVGFSAEAIKNKCEPYHIRSGHGNAKAVGVETLVDEVNSLPRTAADKNELEVSLTLPFHLVSKRCNTRVPNS